MFGYKLTKNNSEVQQKATATINAPIIEALGKYTSSFQDIKTRSQYANAFSSVSEIYAPIMYMGAAFSNMKLKLFSVDESGEKEKEILSHEILEKLASPNPLNNWKDFLLNYFVNKKVFGNAYILKYIPSGFKINKGAFWVLPSQYIFTVPKARGFSSYFTETETDKFIKGYNFWNPAKTQTTPNWNPDEIMHMREPNVQFKSTVADALINLVEGMSPLNTLVEPINNIQKAYEAQNVILTKRGALGILTPKNAKDAVGAVSLRPSDKEDLQEQMQAYGIGKDQWQYIISNVEMGWQSMSLPIKELMLFEGIEASMIAICNTYNFPILLMNYLKGSTFTNLIEAKKSLYQDNIIPEGNAFTSQLNTFLGLPELKLRLEADFSHIPVLQGDLKEEAAKDAITVKTIAIIQNQIFEGKITIEQGIAQLQIILGFSEEETNAMLTNNVSNGNANIQE